ncbi:hypothetical protein ACIBQ1_12580 [Nonomuraea sp. NPDC050153]|uniref:hypothetical protein n=1 Tax=Nonomuraea sp. NPDC050153 TaxID=3364359 RepID=UPI0037902F3A
MALPSIHEGLEEKVPDSLADLHGPVDGVAALPPHLAWSGLTEFDLSNVKLRRVDDGDADYDDPDLPDID